LISSLSKGCTIKIQNFEGPFDLLYHLLEKNKFDIYDIPISQIADQYMDYLFAMQNLDLEITSEFLVIASTLLHIKSRMLLPKKRDMKEDAEEERDPREELVYKLIEYKKYKGLADILKSRELEWGSVYYKVPEVIEFKWEEEILEMNPDDLNSAYFKITEKSRKKKNKNATKITQIIQYEKVSLKSKMKEITRALRDKFTVGFLSIFTLKRKSKTEVVTGFLAILQLAKLKKVRLEQEKKFSEILIHRLTEHFDDLDNFDDMELEKSSAD
jgi:segregation and condensation protein A